MKNTKEKEHYLKEILRLEMAAKTVSVSCSNLIHLASIVLLGYHQGDTTLRASSSRGRHRTCFLQQPQHINMT